MTNFRLALATVALSATFAMTASPASASLIVTPGATGTGINAINAPCDAPNGDPSTTIFGCLNVDHSIQVQYTSTDSIQFDAGGQAKIAPTTTFSDLQTEILGHTFALMVINIETSDDGSVTFTDNLGNPAVVMSLSKNGNNFFTITGDDFTWIKAVADVDIDDIKQIRFDELDGGDFNPPPGVPEPATLALFGAALAGLGALRRRRNG